MKKISPWSLRKFLRVKEWASCLFPCRPLAADQDPADTKPKRRLREAASDGFGDEDDINYETKLGGSKKMSARECHGDNVGVGSARGSESDDGYEEPHFSEEEYIVFVFRDDGAFDVVAKSSSVSSNVNVAANTASILRPLGQKGYKEESVVPNGESKTWTYDGRIMTIGSRDSYQSDGRADSFTFPTLRWDWSHSSPDRMPKKSMSHKCIGFHCCSCDDIY